MKNKIWNRAGIWIILCSVLFYCLNVECVNATERVQEEPVISVAEHHSEESVNLPLNAMSAVLVDAENGRVIYEKSGYEKRAMASTTKIMTLLVALAYGNLEDVVSVSSYAASMPDVQMHIKKGEQYYLKDLLYSLMLESHNDSAVAIAEHIGGSVEAFAGMMNDMAYDLGAYQTHFVTPNGLDAPGHETTAYDLALIARCAITNPEFIAITNTSTYSFTDVAGNRSFTVTNHNAFLNQYEGAIGVKTGFTGDAGYCFVGAVKRDSGTYIAVVLGCGWPPHKTYKWRDMKTLFDYAYENYEKQEVLSPKENAGMVAVHGGRNTACCYGYTKDSVALCMSKKDRVKVYWDLEQELEAPIIKGQVIGYGRIYVNDRYYKSVPVYAKNGVERITYLDVLSRVWNCYIKMQ